MKKTYILLCVLSAMCFFSGCVSTVKTYDAYGTLTGTCKAFGGAAHCYGYANHEHQAVVSESTRPETKPTLQDIPEKYKIPLTN